MTDDHGHHHHGRGGRRNPADYVKDFFSNWSSYDGPLARKITLTLRNRAKAFAPPFKACCGHPGEPGCRMPAPQPPGREA